MPFFDKVAAFTGRLFVVLVSANVLMGLTWLLLWGAQKVNELRSGL